MRESDRCDEVCWAVCPDSRAAVPFRRGGGCKGGSGDCGGSPDGVRMAECSHEEGIVIVGA